VLGFEQGSEHVRREPLRGAIGETRLYRARLTAEEIARDAAGEVIRKTAYKRPPPSGEPAVEENGKWIASITFDREPVERGLTFERRAVEPATVTVEGHEFDVWAVKGGAPDAGWLRSLYLTFTDPQFRDGAMPAVDIEVKYLFKQHAGFDIMADTGAGSSRVGGKFGGHNAWQTARARVDNAFFGGREHGDAATGTDGYDLRLNAANATWHIREIRVTGHDLAERPDFARLLNIESVTAADRPVFLFVAGEEGSLIHRIRNVARAPFNGRAVFTATAYDDRVVASQEAPLRINASGESDVRVSFSTADLPFGVYRTQFDVFEDGRDEPVLSRKGSFGVRSDTELRKAKPGEYLFGLDPRLGSPHGSEPMLAWMRHMGVDIVRHKLDRTNPAMSRESSRVMREEGIEMVGMLDVPKDKDRVAFERNVRQAATFAAEIAREFRPAYWELGNEPDLPFFFPMGIDRYLEGFYPMRDAIKNADPEAVVMNGGLAHARHLPVSQERTREFFRLLDADRIDMVAYHAHGRGATAERNSLRRIREVAAAFGKDHLPMVDTETGVAARGPRQELMQAATCVQKFAFSQSQGQPFLLWFRLLFEQPDSYGNLYTLREPRPVVLAYRAMVETLRGYRFDALLDTGHEELEGYLFNEIDGDGRVALLWANETAQHNLRLQAAPNGEVLDQPRVLDMFGNARPVPQHNGIIEVEAGEHPVYVQWRTREPGYRMQLAAPLIEADGLSRVAPKHLNRGTIRVRNPYDRPLQATLELEARSEIPLRVDPPAQKVELVPGETREVDIAIEVGAIADQVEWPQVWTLFADLSARPDPATWSEIPDEVQGVTGRPVTFDEHALNLAELTGRVEERAPALLMAEVYSPRAQTVTFGASADWWMAWYVNGAQVYDTLEKGNGVGFRITDHTFEVELREGYNLVTVLVLSGSHGWRLVTAPPQEVRRALAAPDPLDAVEVTLREGETVLARQTVNLQPVPPLPIWQKSDWVKTPAQLETRFAPVATLGEAHVENLFVTQPDSSRWWQGDDDLSAQMWLGHDDARLYAVVQVRDNRHHAVESPESLQDGDAIVLALAPERTPSSGHVWHIGRLATNKNGVYEVQRAGAEGRGALTTEQAAEFMQIRMSRSNGITMYRIAIERAALAEASHAWRMNLMIQDNDEGYLKQSLPWRPGLGKDLDPSRWWQVVLQ
jgi:hypothetical protein